MPATGFEINGSTAPAYAAPGGRMTHLIPPEATDLDGTGAPCGAVGYYEAVLGKQIMSEAGHQWYMAFFTDPADLSVALSSITLWDPLAGAWRQFTTATLHRPRWSGGNDGVFYEGWQARVTGMQD